MERITFESFHGEYELDSVYIIDTKEYYSSAFSLKWKVDAVYQRDKDTYCFILNRSDIRLNGNKPVKLMDKIICEMGNSLYPVSLLVSPLLEIIHVNNLDEIKMKWQTCTDELLKKYPSKTLKEYIEGSEKNLSNPRIFISKLYQDLFFSLYFKDIYTPTEPDEGRLMVLENFPERDMNQSYLYGIRQPDINHIHLSGEIMKIIPEAGGHLEVDYETGETGEIKQINGKIETDWREKTYTKQISVKAVPLDVKKPATAV